jgi:NADPH:quinone reductase-like Zn-dependent oxidoreductase
MLQSYKIGDQVFGLTAFNFGCHAEYTAVPKKSMILQMPKEANFDEAATILFGGQTAIYFLHKMGIQSKNKDKVLILGATGSVGTSAIQIAKYYGQMLLLFTVLQIKLYVRYWALITLYLMIKKTLPCYLSGTILF